jgi:glutamyl-tRNA synthetase/glutamyl-Q tRNA(Asp) synthetase
MEPGTESFDDLLRGKMRQDPSLQCGDLLVRDRLGHWTYQFAVTVDDMDQGIDLVVRGEDLLASTGRQLRLARLLGRRRMPLFLHHPLIVKPGGEKLSKASGDTGVRELRDAGMTAADALETAARLASRASGPLLLP